MKSVSLLETKTLIIMIAAWSLRGQCQAKKARVRKSQVQIPVPAMDFSFKYLLSVLVQLYFNDICELRKCFLCNVLTVLHVYMADEAQI